MYLPYLIRYRNRTEPNHAMMSFYVWVCILRSFVNVCMYVLYVCMYMFVCVCRDRLVQNPPVKFYQDYYQCYPSPSSTLLSSFGVAAGNLSIALPIALALLLPLVYLLLKCMDKVPLEDVYTEEEEATAAKMLAGMLLRLRDKRAAGLLQDGILAAWYEELTEVAKASLYQELMYPTSPSPTNEDVSYCHSYSASEQNVE